MNTTLPSALTSETYTQYDGDNSPLAASNQLPHKRNRTQLSCTNCRHAKLKCDRQKPHCSQCVKKGRGSSCNFLPAARKKQTVSMQTRLQHLESLVKGVITGQSPSIEPVNDKPQRRNGKATSISDSVAVATEVQDHGIGPTAVSSVSSGKVLLGSDESTYVGATHWAAILEDIDEMKTYLDDEEEDEYDEEENLKSYTSLIFNAQTPTTKVQLLAALPPRPTVDLLVSRYFNSNSPALPIIHRPAFQRNYRKFWTDPEETPDIFLGLLYSIMIVATMADLGLSEDTPVNHTRAVEAIQTYRECCIQCLVLSNYTKPGPYTLETLFIYMEAEFLLSKDDQVQSFLLVGNVVRLALRMGLHRDSTKVGGVITPFQAEIRRRLWHHLLQLDLLSSFHIGLPGMLPAIDSDTLAPGNYHDEDFDEDSAVLPPPRPDSEITPMSYSICKSGLCIEAGKIVALANRISLPEYQEVMKLDWDLQTAYQKVPPAFVFDTTGPSITDSRATTIRRFSLAILFHKSRCMLHRKHLMRAKQHPEFAFSEQVSLDAAMDLLRCQSLVHEAVLPGGQLSCDRWFLNSLSMHDFLLAAMIVYLSLSNGSAVCPNGGLSPKDEQERIEALEKSHVIWNQKWTVVAESKKAAMVLGIMLKKLQSGTGTNLPASGNHSSKNGAVEEGRLYGVSRLSLNDSTGRQHQIVDAVEPSVSTTGSANSTTPSSGREAPFGLDLPSADIEPLGAMFDVPTDFDWEMFDTHLRPQESVDQTWPDLMDQSTMGNDDYYNF
ncbi:Fungal specific transcription factor domain containing protein [Hyaloscypha variabilis]